MEPIERYDNQDDNQGVEQELEEDLEQELELEANNNHSDEQTEGSESEDDY